MTDPVRFGQIRIWTVFGSVEEQRLFEKRPFMVCEPQPESKPDPTCEPRGCGCRSWRIRYIFDPLFNEQWNSLFYFPIHLLLEESESITVQEAEKLVNRLRPQSA